MTDDRPRFHYHAVKSPMMGRLARPYGVSERWHLRFLELAEHISQWSKDPSTKVGAVIIDPTSKAILSTGFNGLPRGIKDTDARLHDRDFKLLVTAHAELNAIIHAARFGHKVVGTFLYTSLSPCSHCASAIIQAGIACLVTTNDPFPARWHESFSGGRDMLIEAGVEIVTVER